MTTTDPTSSPRPDDDHVAAAVLPEPGDVVKLPTSSADADDLISKLASDQIDELLEQAAPADEGAMEALDATFDATADLDKLGDELVSVAASEFEAELAAAPVPAEVPPAPVAPVQALEPPTEPVAEPPAAPAVVSLESNAAALASIAEPRHSHLEMPPEPASVPRPTDLPAASDAEQVARELAADVAMLSTPLPAVVENEAHLATRSWRQRALDALLALPILLLQVLSAPSQALSDRGREIVGAIGILTLVNAAGLLIYVLAFARH